MGMHKAVDPPKRNCVSELDFTYELGHRLKALYLSSDEAKDRPIQELAWEAATAEEVLREIKRLHHSGRQRSRWTASPD